MYPPYLLLKKFTRVSKSFEFYNFLTGSSLFFLLSRWFFGTLQVEIKEVEGLLKKPQFFAERIYIYMGVSQNEAAGTGSLSQGSVSRVCFVVCFGGLFRTVLLPRTVKFKGSVSGSVSKVCFGVCFGGLSRQSRTSQPYLRLHSSKKCKPIFVNT